MGKYSAFCGIFTYLYDPNKLSWMKRLVTLFFVLAVCGTGAVAQEGAYKTVKDIAYRDAAGDGNIDTMCRLDLYYPADKEGFSTVIWYHGGGLTGGRRDIPEALKEKGFAVVGVEYRLSPHVKVADCVDDAAASAAWVVKHIAEYGGDPRRIFVAGHSAGGYLTSMIGLDKRWLEPYGIDPDTTFAALIPYSGGDPLRAPPRDGDSRHAGGGGRHGAAQLRAARLPPDPDPFG